MIEDGSFSYVKPTEGDRAEVDGPDIVRDLLEANVLAAEQMRDVDPGGVPSDGFRSNVSHPQYDVTRDGQRFMMIRDLEDEASKLIIVLNFFDELKRRVGN